MTKKKTNVLFAPLSDKELYDFVRQQECVFCSYSWKCRVPKPVACPRCHRRFDYPKG